MPPAGPHATGSAATPGAIDSSATPGPGAARDKKNWQQGIESNVADIMMTNSGRGQINGLSNNVTRDDKGAARQGLLGGEMHHKTTIKPLMDSDGKVDNDPETGEPKNDLPAPWNRDAKSLVTNNAYTEGGDGRLRDDAGNRGTGSDSTIYLNPGSNRGLRSDVSLVHEMEHALSQTQGTGATGGFGEPGVDVNVNNRERQAVGLTRSDGGGVRYAGDPKGCHENKYREERNELGDQFVPRTSVIGVPGEAPAGTTPEQLKNMWDTHNKGPDAPR